MAFVQIIDDEIVGLFERPQDESLPGYSVIDDTDPRITEFKNSVINMMNQSAL